MVTLVYPEALENTVREFTIIPEGEYEVEIVAADAKLAGKGYEMLAVRYETEQFGSVFDNVLVGFKHADAEKQESVRRMAYQKLETIASACGTGRFAASEEMVGCRLRIKVEHRPDAKDPEKVWVDVKSYSSIKNVPAAPPAAVPVAAASSYPAVTNAAKPMPWR